MVIVHSVVAQSMGVVALLVAGTYLEPVYADENGDDIRFLCHSAGAIPDTSSSGREPIIPREESSELSLLSQGMIRLYQQFVSSQHYNVCVFTPSCSHFGMSAIKDCGFFPGVLLTMDRFSRCNTFAPRCGYSVHLSSGKLIDPPKTYFFKDTSHIQCVH